MLFRVEELCEDIRSRGVKKAPDGLAERTFRDVVDGAGETF